LNEAVRRGQHGAGFHRPGLPGSRIGRIFGCEHTGRAFYALGDTKIPMVISVTCLGLNLFFAAWLVFPFRQGGLGIANTMSSLVNVALLFYALKKKLGRLDFKPLKYQLLTMAACAILAG